MKFFRRRVFSFFVCLTVPVVASASESRLSVMGYPASAQDPMMMYSYPSVLANASGMVLLDLGANPVNHAEAAFGGLFSSDPLRFAVYVSRDRSLILGDEDTDSFADFTGGVLANPVFAGTMAGLQPKVVDLFFAMPLSGGTGFGARITLGGGLQDDGATRKELSQFDTHLGFSLPMGPSHGLDLSARVRFLGKYESRTNANNAKAIYSSGLDLLMRGRWSAMHSARGTSPTPYASFVLGYASPEAEISGPASASSQFVNSGLGLEAGVDVVPREKTSVSAGLQGVLVSSKMPTGSMALFATNDPAAALTAMANATTKDSYTSYGLHLVGSLETLVTARFGAMVGGRYALWGREALAPNGAAKQSASVAATTDAQLLSMGVFFEQDALRVDAGAMLREFLHNGPYLVTGDATADVVGRVSVAYSM